MKFLWPTLFHSSLHPACFLWCVWRGGVRSFVPVVRPLEHRYADSNHSVHFLMLYGGLQAAALLLFNFLKNLFLCAGRQSVAPSIVQAESELEDAGSVSLSPR